MDPQTWLSLDPDPVTRDALAALMTAAEAGDLTAQQELQDAFQGPLTFGTAGLRGALGPGPHRMNRLVVQRAAAGLAAYLNEHGGGAVVIGYDARHNSDVFAKDSAAVFSGAGLTALVLPEPLPTPVLAFAVPYLGAAAGVMVTASHNPPQDNGYKVYLGGRQIVPPADADISAAIAAVGPDIALDDDWVTLDGSVLEAYIARTAGLIPDDSPRELRTVYTAMHGVGGPVLERVFAAAGYALPARVHQQFDPDPDFPTVSFPNPEEPGAIDLALATARELDADLVIANDPDADRCAIAIPTETDWRMLHGDEVGALLAWWLATDPLTVPIQPGMVFAQSLVSSGILEPIATARGFGYAKTLTGFKWIARVPDLAYGYEEALGYCVDPRGVEDKDGISAALVFTQLAAALKARGQTVQQALDAIAQEFGVYASDQVSVRVDDLTLIALAMQRLRDAPPTELGGLAVEEMLDLEVGAWDLPPTDGLYFVLADRARVIIRPSGTEPKIKAYLQVATDSADGLEIARQRARAQLDALAADVRHRLTTA
jgi:phosphomannomutase